MTGDPVPGWYRLAWFLGRPPPLTSRQWRILGMVSAASFFERYDEYLFSLNLLQIQGDLGIPDESLGWLASFVRAGALLSLPVMLAADRFGRRPVLLASVLAYSVLTCATALAPDPQVFVVLQFAARAFAVAETLLAAVVIVEEFPDGHRGWGVGALAAIQACGAGVASLVFGFVDVVPFGWRSLYAVAVIPLLMIAWWRRSLPETVRYATLDRDGTQDRFLSIRLLSSLVDPLRQHPRRLLAICTAAIVFAAGAGSVTFFAPKFLQQVHGWSPGSVAALTFIGGALAIIGNPVSGRLSDRYGRKPLLAAFAGAFSIAAVAFYNVPGVLVIVIWVAMIFTLFGTGVSLVTITGELFPTSQRGTVNGARSVSTTTGDIVGLACVSLLFQTLGSIWLAITVLGSLCLLVPLVTLLLPETSQRPLDDIAPD